MDSEAVVEYFGSVPLMQRLPTSSVKRIAELVELKQYGDGDFIVQVGERGEDVYFIWEGIAKITRYDPDGGISIEHLKKYDYFGHGALSSAHQVNIVALSKLICLVLRSENCNLLQPKSTWNADETLGAYSMMEHILQLEPVEVDLFRGFTLPDAPRFRQIFGGQLIAQAMAAASKTVDCLKIVHRLHGCFLRVGDLSMPILYHVYRVSDGKSFATRRVDAIQQGIVRFTLLASFQDFDDGIGVSLKKEEHSFEHQDVTIPPVPDPGMLMSMEELRERQIYDPLFPMMYRNKIAKMKFIPWPIEIRFCKQLKMHFLKSSPRLEYWFRARGKLSEDMALHSPSASNARGFCLGRMFNMKGELVVSLSQEGVIRKVESKGSALMPKL